MKVALRALWSSFALMLAGVAVSLSEYEVKFLPFDIPFLALFALATVLPAIPLYYLGLRRRWAWVLVLGLSAVSAISALYMYWTEVPNRWDDWTLRVGFWTLDLIGVYMLLTHEARRWFRERDESQAAF